MKKAIAMLSLAALALTATTTFADTESKDHGNAALRVRADGMFDHGLHLGWLKHDKHLDDLKDVNSTHFVVTGTVASTTSGSITVNVKKQINATVDNSQATVNVTSDTKITREKDQSMALADLKAGDQLVITGNVSGTTMTASRIHLIAVRGKAYGQVTATTSNSITIKNAVTGVSSTFTTSADTKVSVNGESQTTADIQVGDKGFVKFKSEVSGLFAKFIALFR
ncbi:MAG: DUF5666 domain-containing protein [bacterium]|nr:DUF5666 domain-containing protein [bacterium]